MILNKKLSTVGVTCVFLFSVGCGQRSADNSVSNANSNAVLANNAQTPGTSVEIANSEPTSTSTDPAESPAAAYNAAHAARKNKDVAALKKLFSRDVLEFLTMLGKADPEKKQTLDDVLRELCEQPQAEIAQSRNQKINGDKATVEYKDETGNWETMDFVKESGIWKLTINKPESDSTGANPGTN